MGFVLTGVFLDAADACSVSLASSVSLRCTQRRVLSWTWSRAESPLLTWGVGIPRRSGRAHFVFVANLECYVWMPRDMADAGQLACKSLNMAFPR